MHAYIFYVYRISKIVAISLGVIYEIVVTDIAVISAEWLRYTAHSRGLAPLPLSMGDLIEGP